MVLKSELKASHAWGIPPYLRPFGSLPVKASHGTKNNSFSKISPPYPTKQVTACSI